LITLDIDATYAKRNKRQVSANLALQAFFLLKHEKPKRRIEIHLSPSGKGFHLIRYGDDGTLEHEFKLREIYGDDIRRIRIDKWKRTLGSHNYNVLWTKKDGKKAKRISLRTLKRYARGNY
jgi:hypothetical protein